MKKNIIFLLLISTILFAQDKNSTFRQTQFYGGFQAGMINGVGFNFNFLSSNFAEDFPFSAKLSFGVSYLDAGNPYDARRIFINDNTNGTPEKSGKTYGLGLDFLYKSSFLGLKRNYFYAGPRYVMFVGNFNYVGGNEDFDVTSNQWGIGIGLENYFRIMPSLDLVLNFGFDYYLSQILYGHDTAYSPDGQDINPRDGYSFSDADKAINQPQYQIKALLGFSYNLN